VGKRYQKVQSTEAVSPLGSRGTLSSPAVQPLAWALADPDSVHCCTHLKLTGTHPCIHTPCSPGAMPSLDLAGYAREHCLTPSAWHMVSTQQTFAELAMSELILFTSVTGPGSELTG
jgi:hypothetical protein